MANGGLYGGLWSQLNPEGQRMAQKEIQAGGVQANPQRRAIMEKYLQQGFGGGGGRGGGGRAGGGRAGRGMAGGAGVSSGDLASAVGQAGKGLLDPGSDYFQRLMDTMKTRLGKESEAQQRSAALVGAQSGFGGGMSPEMLEAQKRTGVAGMEAMGEAGAGLRLAGPQLGGQLALGAGGLALGGERLAQEESQFGRGLRQRQTEFGGGLGMQQAGMQQQYDIFQQQQAQQQRQFDEQMQFAMDQLYGVGGTSGFGGGGLFNLFG